MATVALDQRQITAGVATVEAIGSDGKLRRMIDGTCEEPRRTVGGERVHRFRNPVENGIDGAWDLYAGARHVSGRCRVVMGMGRQMSSGGIDATGHYQEGKHKKEQQFTARRSHSPRLLSGNASRRCNCIPTADRRGLIRQCQVALRAYAAR